MLCTKVFAQCAPAPESLQVVRTYSSSVLLWKPRQRTRASGALHPWLRLVPLPSREQALLLRTHACLGTRLHGTGPISPAHLPSSQATRPARHDPPAGQRSPPRCRSLSRSVHHPRLRLRHRPSIARQSSGCWRRPCNLRPLTGQGRGQNCRASCSPSPTAARAHRALYGPPQNRLPRPPQPRTREGIALIPFDRCLTLSEESDPCLLVVNRLILTCAL